MAKSRTPREPDSSALGWLATAIERATRSAKFAVSGRLPNVDPGLEVEGLGRVSLPLKRGIAKSLIAACQVAPYGKGTETRVDTRVRKTFELDPQKFYVSSPWNSAIADATRTITNSLGLPADRLEARLYKLLVYEMGGFFRPHRDSEKHDRMVASLVVVLPNPFEGGRLTVRHGTVEEKVAFEEAAAGKTACFCAFYADCEHEVARVTHGIRIALTYNLVLKSPRRKPAEVASPAPIADQLADTIASWVVNQPARPLVLALDHHYTQRGLSLDLLKGADRQLADLVIPAAGRAGCLVHLAQVSRHLLQFADDGSFGYGFSRYSSRAPRCHAIEIGETFEDELCGTEWADLNGKKMPWGTVPFELSAVLSSTPIDDWKPTSEEFEGYTGNEGNTLDRWYHRSALVLWHRDHHFDVVARCGPAVSIPLLCSMVAKLAKTPKNRLEEARTDCIRLARAIIGRWPRLYSGLGLATTEDTSPTKDFPALLLTLHDRETISRFLSKVAEQDQAQPLESLVVPACREFGWNTFAPELKQLIAGPPDDPDWPTSRGRAEVLPRDLEWLTAFCLDETADPERLALAQDLCGLAVDRFCAPAPDLPQALPSWPVFAWVDSVPDSTLPLLLKALGATGRDEDLARVLQFVESLPDVFRLDECQVPALQALVPWSRKQSGVVHPHLMSWLTSVRHRLEVATASQPTPPADSARPADVACNCQLCAQLKAFLADPAHEVARIPAREDMRQHLIVMINRHACDVQYTLERKGSPYSLVLTKTTGSFERALERDKANRRLLKTLDEISQGATPRRGRRKQ
jgi:hypothetical protein